jgi:flagellar protein FliO/FliZ
MNAGLTGMDLLRMVGSMALVIVVLLAVLWGLKRIQNKMLIASHSGRMQVLETQSIGTRQKIVLVRIGSQEVLLGITPTQINALGHWPASSSPAPSPATAQGPEDVA